MADMYWVERGAELDGPYSRAQLAKLLAAGTLQPSDVVGDGQHWHSLHSLLAPRSTGIVLVRLLGYVALAALAAISIATLFAQFADAPLQAKRQQLMVLIPGGLIALAVGGIALFVAMPRGSRATWLLLAGALVAHQGAAQLTFYRAHLALTDQMGAASMTWPREGTLRVEGPIGTGFARQLEAAMATAPGRVYLQIKSEGGLVDEAIAAAAYLKNRGSVSTVVHELCASSCAVLMAAGDEVFLTPWARIGTHDLTPILGAFASFGKARDGYVKHLRDIGFGEAFVKAAKETPPDEMRYFHPILELDQIPRAQLIGNDGALLSFQQAALLRLAHDAAGNDVAREIMEILADSYPDAIADYERPILEALSSDPTSVPALMLPMMDRATAWGATKASGATTLALLSTIADAAKADTKPDPGCTMEGLGNNDIARLRLDLLRSAKAGEGEDSTMSEARYDAFIETVLTHPYVQALSNQDYEPSLTPRAACAFNLALPFGLASIYETEIPAAMKRWLESGGSD